MPNNNNEPLVSCFEKLQVKYKGFERENTDNEKTTTVIYQGSRELIEEAFTEINTNSTDMNYVNIETVRMYQYEGPIWNLEISYAIEKHGNGVSSKGSSYGPKASVLTVRAITRDLETLSNYRMKWNNNLYCTLPGQSTPDWWDTATFEDDKITGHTNREYPGDGVTKPTAKAYWAWGKNQSELPPLLYGYVWHKVKKMTKPGVEYKEMCVYELTESSKHSSQKQAGWAIAKKCGHIAKPENGDFGITDKYVGNWLCEGASISYDGKYWIAELHYLYSPSKKGWDSQIYSKESD